MEKYVPYNKLSKKEKKRRDTMYRRMWTDFGIESPVCRIAHNKKKEQQKYQCRLE